MVLDALLRIVLHITDSERSVPCTGILQLSNSADDRDACLAYKQFVGVVGSHARRCVVGSKVRLRI